MKILRHAYLKGKIMQAHIGVWWRYYPAEKCFSKCQMNEYENRFWSGIVVYVYADQMV